MSNLNREKLDEFLGWVAEKGLMKQTTARSLRSACRTVLSVMDDEEARDVSSVDLQTVMQRYQNLYGMDVNPSTMKSYGRRVKQAVSEFVEYNRDKANWRPSGAQRSRQSARSPKKPKPNERISDNDGLGKLALTNGDIDVASIVHRFPLRRDAVVTISGIPFDVNRSEMSRLTAFLSNLVATVEQEQQPRMLSAPGSGTSGQAE